MLGNTMALSNKAQQKLTWHLVDGLLHVPASERFNWDEYNESIDRNEKEQLQLDNAIARLYPNVPTPNIPQSLPLEAYTGTYAHLAYNAIVLVVKNNQIYADASSRTWPFTLSFVHISGDSFLVI